MNTKPTLLWVDDEYGDVPELTERLKNDGWNVDCAANLADAHSKLKEKLYDLIILDILIPFGTGWFPDKPLSPGKQDYPGLDFLTMLKSLPTGEHRPAVIVLTIVDDERLAKHMHSLKKSGFIWRVIPKAVDVTIDDISQIAKDWLEKNQRH